MVLYGTNDPPSSGSASPTEAKDEMCSFLVIKHSWKGKYKRVFCVGALSITTYNPNTMEATNQWQYSDFISIQAAARGQASQPNNEFIITFKKGKKTDSMRFSSDHRAAIITETMRYRHEFGEAEGGAAVVRLQAALERAEEECRARGGAYRTGAEGSQLK